ncbi:methyltransferase [Dyella sp.]|uniref:class I SAM-dependent methyltransferase n=1 Tax=Dyella sp. TaxID=1869338 RepID=UPI002ED26454
MRSSLLFALAFSCLAAPLYAQTPTALPPTTPSSLADALNDPARGTDRADDDRRKIADIMAFAQVRPGQKIMELIPGKGYFTRVFSAVVGVTGHVYLVWPDEYAKEDAEGLAASRSLLTDTHYGNVSVLNQPAAQLSSPELVDLVFTSQNYHDYPDPFMGKVDLAKFNKQVFAALKPGGLFVIIDHAAPAGSGMQDTDTLHRIDPAIVRKQVEAAGFIFDGQSGALRNLDDKHTLKVFDKSIRGHTDQFIYRFRKPA